MPDDDPFLAAAKAYSSGGSSPVSAPAPTSTHGQGWWTPDRVNQAVSHLQTHAQLSPTGARGLVARWMGVEAGGGPSATNPSSGAFGIGQWVGPRKNGVPADFEGQLNHAVKELNGSESAAARRLRTAQTSRDAAVGASMYERAEGYNHTTGTDNYTEKTIRTMGRIGGSVADDPFKAAANAYQPEPTEDPFKAAAQAYTPAAPQSPVPESPDTIAIQKQAALNPNVMARSAVLTTDPSQDHLFENDPNFQKVTAPKGVQGTLWVNTQKAAKLKLRTPEEIQHYVAVNPAAMMRLIGKPVAPVDDTSQGVSVHTTVPHPQTGQPVEASSTVVTNEKDAMKQREADQASFGHLGAVTTVIPTSQAVKNRLVGQGVDPASLAPVADEFGNLPLPAGVDPNAPAPIAKQVAKPATASKRKVSEQKKVTGQTSVAAPKHEFTDSRILDDDQVDEQGNVKPQPNKQQPEEIGTVKVDPKWSDEDKVRYALNHTLIGRDTPNGPITSQDVDNWIEASKATGNPNALVQGDKTLSQLTVHPDVLQQIRDLKKKTPDQLAEELKQRTIAPPTDQQLREQAIKELTSEKTEANITAMERRGETPAIDPTEEEIQAKVDDLKAGIPRPEEASRSYDAAQRMEGNLGAAEAGFYSWGGSAIHRVGGLLRPFWTGGYKALRQTGNEMQTPSAYRNQGQGAKDTGESIAQGFGEMVPGLAELAFLPGGAPAKFAFLGASQAAGEGKSISKVAEAGLAGYGTGKLFGAAEKMENPLARLGTVFGGSMAINAATGMPIDQNVQSSLVNTAFEVTSTYGDKAVGKFYRFWHGGDPYDLHITEKGEVNLLPTNPKRTITGGEVVTDPKNPIYNQKDRRATAAVPETEAEPEKTKYTSVVDEIKQRGLDTKAKIQQAFPQLSREEAADYRRQAFPDTARPTEETPRTVTHPDPAIDGKEVVAETADGRVVVPNDTNASGVSVVKDRATTGGILEPPVETKSDFEQLPREQKEEVIRQSGKDVEEKAAEKPAIEQPEAPKPADQQPRSFILPKGEEVTRPLAAEGLTSYRYRNREGDHVAIGAKDDADALREAGRSISGQPTADKLDVWNGKEYVPVTADKPAISLKDVVNKRGKQIFADEEAAQAAHAAESLKDHGETYDEYLKRKLCSEGPVTAYSNKGKKKIRK